MAVEITYHLGDFSANDANTTYHLLEGGLLDGYSAGALPALDALSDVTGRVFLIDGLLSFDAYGLFVGRNRTPSPDNVVTIGETGLIKGNGDAVTLFGESQQVVNLGTILTKDAGKGISAYYGLSTITNEGVIDAGQGIYVAGSGNVIKNTGTITAAANGIAVVTIASETSLVVNNGSIFGGDYSIVCYDGDDKVINTGILNGMVHLSTGNDTFVSKGGKVNGVIYGGEGDDLFVFDRASLRLVEFEGANSGNDTLRASVDVDLGTNFVETVILTGKGNLSAVGSDSDNAITGNAGNNRLAGLDGADRLQGKRGSDILTGGAGADLFLFDRDGSRDWITDFEDGVDRIDISSLAGITSIRDLKKNHLVEDGPNLIITDGETEIVIADTAWGEITKDDFLF